MNNNMHYFSEENDYGSIKVAAALIITGMIICYFTKNFLFLFILVIMSAFKIGDSIDGYKKYQKNQKIKKYGKRIPARIVDFECREFSKHYVNYALSVSFFHPKYNQEIIFKTPDVNFHPIEDLGGFECNAYIQ